MAKKKKDETRSREDTWDGYYERITPTRREREEKHFKKKKQRNDWDEED